MNLMEISKKLFGGKCFYPAIYGLDVKFSQEFLDQVSELLKKQFC